MYATDSIRCQSANQSELGILHFYVTPSGHSPWASRPSADTIPSWPRPPGAPDVPSPSPSLPLFLEGSSLLEVSPSTPGGMWPARWPEGGSRKISAVGNHMGPGYSLEIPRLAWTERGRLREGILPGAGAFRVSGGPYLGSQASGGWNCLCAPGWVTSGETNHWEFQDRDSRAEPSVSPRARAPEHPLEVAQSPLPPCSEALPQSQQGLDNGIGLVWDHPWSPGQM